MRHIHVPGRARLAPYSDAVSRGTTLYVSGQIPVESASGQLVGGGVQAQTIKVLENLDEVLRAAGTDRYHVMRVGIYLADPADFDAMNDEYARFFDRVAARPARSTIHAVPVLAGALVEIDAIAEIPQKKPTAPRAGQVAAHEPDEHQQS